MNTYAKCSCCGQKRVIKSRKAAIAWIYKDICMWKTDGKWKCYGGFGCSDTN